MSKAQIPVSHIIAILLGVMIIALLGYWFFVTGGQFSGTAAEAACRGKLVQYCTAWSGCGYKAQCKPVDTGKDFYDYAPECEVYKGKSGFTPITSEEDLCKKTLGQLQLKKRFETCDINNPGECESGSCTTKTAFGSTATTCD